MALTKSKLKEILSTAGVEESKMSDAILAIMDGHTASIDALREERDAAKKEAEEAADAKKKLAELQKEVDSLKEGNKDSYKVKYEAMKEEFAEFKKGIENEKTKATKTEAYKALLKEVGISDKRIDSVLKVSEIDKIKLDKDGKIEGADDLKKSLAEEWADFIVKTDKKGADTVTPPANTGGGKKTKDEIMAIKDTAARQQAMLENKDLFLN